MDTKHISFIVVILEYIAVFKFMSASAESKKVHTVTLYTDLVDIIGKNNSCARRTENATEEHLFSKQGIIISKYEFHDVDVFKSLLGKCDVSNIRLQRYSRYNWTCFATDNSTSRDTNWFFVNCIDFDILTIRCLEHGEVSSIIGHLCKRNDNTENNLCHDFSYGKDGKYAVCSRSFRLQRIIRSTTDKPGSYTTVGDIIAYLCVAFILVTFLLAVLIPAEKCKPTYKYDKEKERRVPLEIYAMYGVNYKPAAKKRRTKTSISVTSFPAISSHLGNVAVVANTPVDWKGHKTKFNFHQPILNPVVNWMAANGEAIDKDQRTSFFNNRRKRSSSVDSTETVDNFDYSLFQNQIKHSDENVTSERKMSVSSKIRKNSLTCDERKLEYCNRRKSSSSTCNKSINEEAEKAKNNDVYVANLENNSSVSDHEISVGFSDCEEKDQRRPHIACGRHSEYSNKQGFLHNSTKGEQNDIFDERDEAIINSDRYEENDNEIIESEDNDYASDDIDIFEQEQSNLKLNYRDNKNCNSCKCNSRCSIGSDTTSTEENAPVKLETIRECQSNALSSLEDNSINCSSCHHCCRYNHNVETNVLKVNSKPFISITVELPNNIGIGNIQSAVKHVHDKSETRPKITKRSISTDSAPKKRNTVQLRRKYSIC